MGCGDVVRMMRRECPSVYDITFYLQTVCNRKFNLIHIDNHTVHLKTKRPSLSHARARVLVVDACAYWARGCAGGASREITDMLPCTTLRSIGGTRGLLAADSVARRIS